MTEWQEWQLKRFIRLRVQPWFNLIIVIISHSLIEANKKLIKLIK